MNITGLLSRRCFCRYVFTRHVTTVFAIWGWMLSSHTKKLLFIANLKSPPNDHASFYASSEKDRFLYTSCLIASRKRTRSDIYVVHTWGKKSGTAEYLSAANGEIFYPVFCRSEWFLHGNEHIILYRSREIWEISRRVQKKSARKQKLPLGF